MLILIAVLLYSPPASILQQLNAAVKLHEVVIAPDGSKVAWVEQVPTPDGPAADKAIIQVQERAPGAQPRTIAAKPGTQHDEGDAVFSPDGTKLAFLSDAEKDHQPQLYVANLATGQVRQLTHVIGNLARPRFSPDGKTIAVLYLEGAPDAQGPLAPATKLSGVVEEKIAEQRIALVDDTGLRAISPPDLFVYEYAWRPDGKAFAATAAHGSGDDNWWIAQLDVIEVSGAARVVQKPAFQICAPAFSPDGKRIAFIEGLMSDEGANGGDVFVIPADGSAKARNWTPGLRASASSLHWCDADHVLFGAEQDGDSAFFSTDGKGAAKTLWRGSAGISAQGYTVDASFSADGKLTAARRETFTDAPEVVAGPLGDWKPLTSRNTSIRGYAGEARSVHWKSDGFDVQGWLIAPAVAASASAAKAPMVVIVHGGPASAVHPKWTAQPLLLASQGYYVFLPNPRGSFGQSEKFTRANVKDFGHGDLRDILRGVDAALRVAPVDPQRVGIAGHSYGGYMAMWAVTQTHRFKAAVAGAGIANWQSYSGQNRIDQWMIPYFGKTVYDDLAVYARSSPITYIKNVRTPTLMLNGDRDAECPLPQAQEFWHALKTLGVETQLVVYEDEGHQIRQPAHARDQVERMVGWFDSHLKGPEVKAAR